MTKRMVQMAKCKLSHIPETKEERCARLKARRARQLLAPAKANPLRMAVGREQLLALRKRFWVGQIAYRPHQGAKECARRARQVMP